VISAQSGAFLCIHFSCLISVQSGDVDRHRVDADLDPDPTFHFEADPDLTPNFTHVERRIFLLFIRHQCQFYVVLSFLAVF
jgi:hypothetical protein